MENEGHTDLVRDVAVHPKVATERRCLVSFCVAMAAFCGIVVAGWLLQSTALAGWQRENLHWNFLLHGLMFLVAVSAMRGLGRSAREYGLCLPGWREGMNVGVFGAVLYLVFVAIGLAMGAFTASKTLIAFPIGTLIYQVIFVAIFEEFFFRGFLQHEFDRSWPRGGAGCQGLVDLGWLITAILFGLGHGMGRFNPFLNAYGFEAGTFLATFVFGCVLGFLRVRSVSIWPCVVLHLAANVSTTIFLTPTSKAGEVLLFMGFFSALPLVAIGCVRTQRN